MFNSIKEAVEYAISIHDNYHGWETVPSAIYEKNGKYNAGTFDEYDHAVACGWKFVGTPAQLSK